MIKRLLSVLLLTLLLFGALFGARVGQILYAMENHYVPPPPTVAVTAVKKESWRPYLKSVGSLTAQRGVTLSNELPGQVVQIHFKSGQQAEAGELLLELDTSTDEAELTRLLAARKLAEIQHQRAQKLATQSFASASNLDETRAQLDQASAAVALQRALLAKKQIRAPFAGTLGIRQVNPGQYLPAGSAIAPLQSLDPLYLDFTLPENRLADVSNDQIVHLSVDAYPNETLQARVVAINPQVDANSRTVKVRATVANEEQRLRPGMFVDVTLYTGAEQPVLTLPDTAITYTTFGQSVYVIKEVDGRKTVDAVQIRTGDQRNGRVEIVTGLSAGTAVVSAGQVKLRNGAEVLISDLPAPGERNSAGMQE